MRFFIRYISCVFIAIALSQSVYAEDSIIGQYMTVNHKPQSEQVDLLSQAIQVRFPQSIQTIGDAINYLLKISGYSLVDVNQRSDGLKITLTKPLPLIDRDYGPMRLKEALTTLSGPAFYLVSDPINRTVNFKLKSKFIKTYSSHPKA